MAEGRRICYDDEDDKRYLKLRATNIFKDLDLLDLFLIMVAYGKKRNMMAPMGKLAQGKIRSSTIDSTNARYLMMALAADRENTFDVLTDDNGDGEEYRSAEDKYFSICEEYAKAGMDLFFMDYYNSDDILEDMEMELLEFYDKFVKED